MPNTPDCLFVSFAAFWAIKENPESETVGKILEPVFDSSLDENEISRTNGPAFFAGQKLTASAQDHINLVARVRRLQIDAARRVKFHLQAAVFPERDRSLLPLFRKRLECIVNRDRRRFLRCH